MAIDDASCGLARLSSSEPMRRAARALADHAHQPHAAFAGRTVVEVLDQLKLGAASHDGRLELFAASGPAPIADDSDGAPNNDRELLAFKHLVGDGLIDDRVSRRGLALEGSTQRRAVR